MITKALLPLPKRGQKDGKQAHHGDVQLKETTLAALAVTECDVYVAAMNLSVVPLVFVAMYERQDFLFFYAEPGSHM